jgi:hypothetical protein
MKWKYIKWILIAALIACVVYLYYRYTTKEGFVTMSNVQYPYKEVFLVAPTENNQYGNLIRTFSVPSDGQYINQGYTWTEAQTICRGYGGDLATAARVQLAYDNSGNWCPAGWTLDSKTSASYLPTKLIRCGRAINTIGSTVSTTPAIVDAYQVKRAFAICYAVKPAQPSVAVHPFNSLEYSMINGIFLNNIMTGTGTDIFPVAFTPSQAYRAIDVAGVDNKNKFNSKSARDWLIANYETVDANILAQDPTYIDNPANWTNFTGITAESCSLIKTKDDIVSDQVLLMKQYFKDISGYVISAVKTKEENAKIQGMVYSLCKDTKPETSPACAKLAKLDFDLFYTNPTHNTLADLENLNTELYMRREEVCGILHNIRTIKSVLGCPYEPRVAECSEGCNIDPVNRIFDCSNTNIFDINGVGALRYNLEQISPLFDVPAYNVLLESIMANLSYIVETPSLASIDPSMNLSLIKSALNSIQDLIRLGSGS